MMRSRALCLAMTFVAFAGLLPDGARLTPSVSQWSAGAFSRVQLASGEGSAATIVQLAGRAGYALRDTVGSRFEAAVDASLIGGAVVRAGDFVVDGSLRGRVERLGIQVAGQ